MGQCATLAALIFPQMGFGENGRYHIFQISFYSPHFCLFNCIPKISFKNGCLQGDFSQKRLEPVLSTVEGMTITSRYF